MMFAVVIAALLQSAAINNLRDSYIACLTKGLEEAKAQKMPAEASEPFFRQSCAAVEEKFEASLIAFDLKNKVPRKRAVTDAQLQIDDFVSTEVERYKAMTTPK